MVNSTAKDHPTYAAPHFDGDWKRSVFLDSPHVDNMMTALLHLGAEFWTLKRRTLVLEKFLDERSLVDRAEVDAYMPNASEVVAWGEERDAFIDRVFSVLTRTTEDVKGRFEHPQ